MRLVLASPADPAAQALAARWGPERAALVTPADLSRPGWRHQVGAPGRSAAGLGGRVVPAEEVEAVVVRLAAVPEHELDGVRPEDRGYVAAEMTAFLLAWLDGLNCPVVNRPTPGCLNGPPRRPEQWTVAASRVGLPVVPIRRRTPAEGPVDEPAAPDEVVATVVGDRCLGGIHPRRAAQARRLAAQAGVDLLGVRFTDPGPRATFLGASAWPDLADPATADALDTYLGLGAVAC
jgi:hypothetical protein